MKKTSFLLAGLLAFSIFLSGCGVKQNTPIVYSNLTEESIRYDLESLMMAAAVPADRRSVFFSHVDQFNSILKPEWLTEGFAPVGDSKYDPYDVQDIWMETYPDFMGYNCRITAFSLFEYAFSKLPKPEITPDTTLLEFDLSALDSDPSALPESERQFLSFFSPIPTEDTKDISIHAEKVKNAWMDRGFAFGSNSSIRMINVFLHYQDGEENLLHVGHSGILLPTPEGNLWFVEKLAFQQPYQLVVFENRHQLYDYLMEKYDLDQGQPTAKPFIFENDELMEY